MLAYVVSGHYPNVREKPGGCIIPGGTLSPGDPLIVFAEAEGYYRCQTPRNIGWVWSKFVRLDSGGELHELEVRVVELEAGVEG